MELVGFIATETGTDLIVSFAVIDPDQPTTIYSLTIIRTPQYEAWLDASARGASLAFEKEDSEEDTILLRQVTYVASDQQVVLQTDKTSYDLDLRKVDPKGVSAMWEVFQKINFDASIRLTRL